jgi:two-component system sensor histidine kinase VicK
MVDVRRRLCNLKEISEKQIKEFEVLLKNKNIRLNEESLGKDLFVWADEDKLTQVINNLLSNAIKFTPEGGAVTLRIYPAEKFVRIECIDTGPGISLDKLDKLFNKFERLDATKEGTGLGLTITKDIVEMHKGKIWAESKLGEGSKFIVILPCDLRRISR